MVDLSSVAVVVVSPLRLHGKAYSRGDVLHLAPAEAAACVGSGRGKLKDPADRRRCDEALRSERDRVLALCGRGPPEPLRFRV